MDGAYLDRGRRALDGPLDVGEELCHALEVVLEQVGGHGALRLVRELACSRETSSIKGLSDKIYAILSHQTPLIYPYVCL